MNRVFVLVLLSLAACKRTVDTEGFEKTIKERTDAMGLSASKVTCAKGVEAKVGAKFTCQVALDKSTYDLDVTITNVDKENKRVDMDTAWSKGSAVIAKKLVENTPKLITDTTGLPATVDCGAEPLIFLSAGTAKCKATVGTQTVDVVLTFDDKSVLTNWTLEPKMLVRSKLEPALTADIAKQVPGVTVTCGTTDLVERPADGNVMCDATDGKVTKKVKVVVSPELKVERWEIL